MHHSTFQRGALAALLLTTLAACGRPPVANTPQPSPLASRPAASVPAAATPQPGGSPAASAPAPTVVAARPVLDFSPREGAPGTLVKTWGSGYTPSSRVAIRLGQPAPMGEVLVSAAVGSDGKWQAELVIPDRLPSGDPITGEKFRLVAMDEGNVALASAPFGFVAAGPSHADAPAAVEGLLTHFASGDIAAYVAQSVRDEMAAGRPAHAILGLAPLSWTAFQVHAPQDRPSEVLFVPATLHYPTFVEERLFELVGEGQSWKVRGSSLSSTRPVEPDAHPTPVGWPGPEWQMVVTSDFNADGVSDTLYEVPGMLPTGATFDTPELQAHALVAEQVMLAQDAVPGPRVMLEVDAAGIRADGAELISYQGTDIGGFLVSTAPNINSLIYIIPLNADGSAAGLPMGLGWDGEANGYRIISYEAH